MSAVLQAAAPELALVQVSTIDKHWVTDTVRRSLTWDAFKELVYIDAPTVRKKAELPLTKLAAFVGDHRREGVARLEAIHGVECDYDAGLLSFDDAGNLLSATGIKGLLVTTSSHTPEKPRWRFFAPTSGPLPPERRHGLVARINGALGGVLARESFTPNQFYYYGTTAGTVEHRAREIPGTCIDLLPELDAGALGPPVPVVEQAAETDEVKAEREAERCVRAERWLADPALRHEAEEALALLDPGCSRREWRCIGASLHRQSGRLAGDMFDKWSAGGGEKYKGRAATLVQWDGMGNMTRIGADHLFNLAAEARAARARDAFAATLGPIPEHFLKLVRSRESPKGEQDDAPTSATVVEVGSKRSAELVNVSAPAACSEPPFEMRRGRPLATRGNLYMALEHGLAGATVRRDTFTDEVILSDTAPIAQVRRIADEDYSRLCKRLERDGKGFVPIRLQLMREVVALAAADKSYDSAKDWLGGLVWDGVPRVDTFLAEYAKAGDTPYTRAVSRYLFTALAGRVIEPGVKADMVLVLVGPQGTGKSSLVRALAPTQECFLELDLSKDSTDLAREMRGKLVVELGELKGMRAKEQAHLKGFLTCRVDEWVHKYCEHSTRYARRSIFIGTVNNKEFLPPDDEEHRRWLPVDAPARTPEERNAAMDALELVRDQLWAEGAALFAAGGIAWYEAEKLAKEVHKDFEEVDAWRERIETWLGAMQTAGGQADRVTTEAMLRAVGMSDVDMNSAHKRRMAALLRKLGYVEGARVRDGGERHRVWSKA